MAIYYSYRVEDEKITGFTNNKEYKVVFGKAHYSYKIAAKKFLSTLEKNKYISHEIIRPEMYKHKESFLHIKDFNNKKNIHLIFKPIEHITLLKNSKNIGVFAWEFDKITEKDIGGNPFLNQKRMLSLLDEIWVPSSYTEKVLKRYGFDNTHFIPAPIQKPIGLDNGKSLLSLIANLTSIKYHPAHFNEEPTRPIKDNIDLSKINKIYFSILNPWDYRKNLSGLLKTFEEFSKKFNDTLLIIKITIDNKETLLTSINEIIYHNFHHKNVKSNNILFVSEYMPEKTLYSIMSKVDFYYNLSFAEGQFLPILESMILGTVPISPDTTAMSDYITENNALVIKSKPTQANPNASAFNRSDFIWFEPNLKQALDQLENSYFLSNENYQKKATNAIKTVQKNYGENEVLRKIEERINE